MIHDDRQTRYDRLRGGGSIGFTPTLPPQPDPMPDPFPRPEPLPPAPDPRPPGPEEPDGQVWV